VSRQLAIAHESWPIAGEFTISRGSKTSAEVVVVTLTQDGHTGRGECVPYAHYDETIESATTALEAARQAIEHGITRDQVADHIAPMSARNALDCALWDLEAKLTGRPVWQLAGLAEPTSLVTAYTIGLGTPETMAAGAAEAVRLGRPLLKLKLGRDGDAARLRAVRLAAPDARLIVDANEGWQPDALQTILTVCRETGVELVEQPLPADDDEHLRQIDHAVTICADESAHDRAGLPSLVGKYDAINVKLDKTGGLTEALALTDAALDAGMKVMAGCMLATSLAMAPATLFAQKAEFVDLDGPLLLARDREPGITFDGAVMLPPPPQLWG
jgi:L-alanine-DL-glutamate epimerase-like enolase superfamily enzyme